MQSSWQGIGQVIRLGNSEEIHLLKSGSVHRGKIFKVVAKI